MNLALRSVMHPGTFNERVMIEVTGRGRRIELGEYLLVAGRWLGNGDGPLSNRINILLWFPDQRLQVGDQVVVWTRDGEDYKSALEGGPTVHHFYLERGKPLWDRDLDDNAAAVLMRISDWTALRV